MLLKVPMRMAFIKGFPPDWAEPEELIAEKRLTLPTPALRPEEPDHSPPWALRDPYRHRG